MRIGNIELPAGAGLAPMAGVTDAAMRLLCFEQGAAWAVSEMLSAKGWIYSRGKNRNAVELLARLPGEGAGGLQLFGREPEYVARAASELEDRGFLFIDLNFGCPAPKITGNGEGSAMMREPEQIERVVSAAVRATKLPVTAKIRAGWDETCINAPEVAELCERAGASAVAVHARTRAQQYAGRADWRIIREVKARGAVVLGLATEDRTEIAGQTDMVFYIPKISPFMLPSLSVIPMQLFAYYVASMKGCDIDKPRNLAKSVTVE